MTDILSVRGLTAGYGPLRVLHDISFRVAEGERIGLVGLNGHCKTTLFRAISSSVYLQSGSVKFLGQEIGGPRSSGPGRKTPGIVRMGLAMAPKATQFFLDCRSPNTLIAGPIPRWRGANANSDETWSSTSSHPPQAGACVGGSLVGGASAGWFW